MTDPIPQGANITIGGAALAHANGGDYAIGGGRRALDSDHGRSRRMQITRRRTVVGFTNDDWIHSTSTRTSCSFSRKAGVIREISNFQLVGHCKPDGLPDDHSKQLRKFQLWLLR